MAKLTRKGLAVIVAVMSLASCAATNKLSETISSTAAPSLESTSVADSAQAISSGESTSVADSANILTDQSSAGQAESTVNPKGQPVNVTAGQPQLIKRAQLSIVVDSVDDGLKDAAQIIRTYQGDILDLQDNQIEAVHRNAYLRIRVPQANLDTLLENLSDLGTVRQQGLNAEDVSPQIVDAQARLRNLRKSEESLLKIMERSGEISNVLEVSRELSRVREQIEQIDARVQNLQTQVRYSTIDLTIAAAIAFKPVERPLVATISATWKEATHSVGELTVDLMQLGLWLLAYSPYLLVVAIASVIGYRTLRHRLSE